jgi:hypothetical protein
MRLTDEERAQAEGQLGIALAEARERESRSTQPTDPEVEARHAAPFGG